MGVTPFQAMYQCRGISWEARGVRASWVGQWGRRWASSADRMDNCTSGPKGEGGRAIDPYDYISCRETSEKVGCSIKSAWVGAGAAFNECGHGEIWEIQGKVDGLKISFSLGAWFSCAEQTDRQERLFFNLGCIGREASCCKGKLSAGRWRVRS